MSQFLISLVFVLAMVVTTAAGDGVPPFKITTKRDNDTVEVRADKDKTVFIVKSPFGISQAMIERKGEKWSDAVVLRLHLKGLENFRVTNEKVKLEASVSSQEGKVRVWKDGEEDAPLDAKNPYWMEIRMVGGDGKPAKAVPLKDGYFEMQLPRALFDGNPKTITVSWIDFFRN
jgi:hypothetical protein